MVNGQSVTPDQTLSRLVAAVPPGGTARLDVLRNNRPQSVTVTVARRPSPEQLAAQLGQNDDFADEETAPGRTAPAGANSLGLSVQPLTPQIARQVGVDSTVQGVVVAQVDPASDAAQKLRRGDVVQAVNGTPVRSAAEMTAAVAQARAAGRPQVLLLVSRRGGQSGFVPVKIARG